MQEYLKGLSVTLCLLSEKITDTKFSEIYKKQGISILENSNVFLGASLNLTELIKLREDLIKTINFLDLGKILNKVTPMNAKVITSSILEFLKTLDKKILSLNSLSYSLFDLKKIDQNLFRNNARNEVSLGSKTKINFTQVPELLDQTESEIFDFEKQENSENIPEEISQTKNDSNKIVEQKISEVSPLSQPTSIPLVYTTFGDSEQKHIEERRTKIMNILKQGGGSIRDLSRNFPGMNEKTIQRDLNELMREKRVIMLGKKRWAKYYLK
jgi:hypothetical protein